MYIIPQFMLWQAIFWCAFAVVVSGIGGWVVGFLMGDEHACRRLAARREAERAVLPETQTPRVTGYDRVNEPAEDLF